MDRCVHVLSCHCSGYPLMAHHPDGHDSRALHNAKKGLPRAPPAAARGGRSQSSPPRQSRIGYRELMHRDPRRRAHNPPWHTDETTARPPTGPKRPISLSSRPPSNAISAACSPNAVTPCAWSPRSGALPAASQSAAFFHAERRCAGDWPLHTTKQKYLSWPRPPGSSSSSPGQRREPRCRRVASLSIFLGATGAT